MFNPERLTLARTRRSLKKAEFARLVGKVPRTISDYERGNTEPVAETVERFSEVLHFPEAFFYEPLADSVPRDGASFRALSRMTASQRDSALAVGTLGVMLNDWIEERFELPEAEIPDLQPGIIDPEGAAALVRAGWGLGEAPVSNMLHLVESHGVRVFSLAEECKEVDAFSFWMGSTPYICVSTYKTAERSIFDVAHELGHLVLHRGHAAPRGRNEEREADAFASSFLMPKADIMAEAPFDPDFDELVDAKGRWRVSTAALAYRMHSLSLISDWHYRSLCIAISRIGRDQERRSVPRELSQLLTKVFDTMRDEGVTRKDIAAALLLFPDDLDSLTFGLSISVLDGEANGDATTDRRRGHLRLV